MRGKLVVKFDKNIIEMNREFAKYAAVAGTDEYNLLQQTRKDYPTFSVVRKQIKKNKDKESYKGLTYEYMESYIKGHDDKEETIMKEYLEKRLHAECHSIRYPVIKKWFLEKFPEVAKFGMVEVEETEAPAQENDEVAEQKSGKVMDFLAPTEGLEKVG